MRHITVYPGLASDPHPTEVTFADLAENLTTDPGPGPCTTATCQGKDCPNKKATELWAPHRLSDPARGRKNDNVAETTLLAFDLDHSTEDACAAVLQKAQDNHWAVFAHTTHNHREGDGNACYRVVLDLSRPLKPSEHHAVRQRVADLLGLAVDTSTLDLARFYFGPTRPSDAPWDSAYLPGQPVDPDALHPAAKVITLDPLRARLLSVKSPESRELVRRALSGKPFAEPGQNRDATLLKLAGVVGLALPGSTPWEAIEGLFGASLRAMPQIAAPPYNDKLPWLDVFKAQWERSNHQKQVEEKAAAQNADLAQRLSRLTTPDPETNSTAPYTEEEMATWADRMGLPRLDRHWIIQKANVYWVLGPGGHYLPPRLQSELAPALRDDLSRSPVQMTYTGAKGQTVRKPVGEILMECCTVARKVMGDLTLQHSRYDTTDGTFYHAVTPLRPIKAAYHPQIDHWLKLLGPKVIEWVAAVTRLDRQCAALYLDGPPSAGKGLLANGLARLWTTGGPSNLKRIMSNFNADLTRCPLVFGDETLPREKDITARFRELVGSSTRTVNEKNVPEFPLRGAVRVLLAANNDNLFDVSNSDLSHEDVNAVAARVVHVKVSHEAVQYLEEMGGPAGVRDWIDRDMIAAHALWLAQNVALGESERFLVTGEGSEMVERLNTTSQGTGAVLSYLTAHLSDPKAALDDTIWVTDQGELLVNVDAFNDTLRWNVRVPGHQPLTVSQVAKSLRTVSKSQTTVPRRNPKGKQRRYWHVNEASLVSWAERQGTGDSERMRDLLKMNGAKEKHG